jgi:hypothetical protein
MDVVLSFARGAASAVALAGLGVIASCTSSTTDARDGADAGADTGIDANFKSSCGKPGDPGNSLGVGKFCQYTIADCGENSKAKLCTTLDPTGTDNYFCTFRCNPATDLPDVCGDGARCACDSAGTACGCFPTRCDGPSSDGGGADALPDVRADARLEADSD